MTLMETNVHLAEDDSPSPVVCGLTQTGARELIIENDIGLAPMIDLQPPVNRFRAGLTLLLPRFPALMKIFGKYIERCLFKNVLESVSPEEAQPACGNHYTRLMRGNGLHQGSDCWFVKESFPKAWWWIYGYGTEASNVFGAIEDDYFMEVQHDDGIEVHA
jgi:hypothetical protein